MEPLSEPEYENIFSQIDKDNDGFITLADLQATNYLQSLFQSNPNAANQAFNSLPLHKMNLTDFKLLCHAARYNLYDLVFTKFAAEQFFNKYLNVSAPGQAAPGVKKSYLRLKVSLLLPRPMELMEEEVKLPQPRIYCIQSELNQVLTRYIKSKR